MFLFIISCICILVLFIMSIDSSLRFLNMLEWFKKEMNEWFKKDKQIDSLKCDNFCFKTSSNLLTKSCTQKENEIQELKKKIQREQTWKSNARKQLKKRTKQRDELLKKIKNNTTL